MLVWWLLLAYRYTHTHTYTRTEPSAWSWRYFINSYSARCTSWETTPKSHLPPYCIKGGESTLGTYNTFKKAHLVEVATLPFRSMLVIAGRCGAFKTCGKCPHREQPERVAVYRGVEKSRNQQWQTQSLGVWLAGFIHFRKHNDNCLIVSKRSTFAYLDYPNPHRRYPSMMYLLLPIYPNAARYRFSKNTQRKPRWRQ